MSLMPNLRPLPEADRRECLGKFLALINCDPNLAHLRSLLRTGPERQVALFAALERDVVKGSPAACPPAPDDQADILLCDILEAIDRDPEIKRHGAYYGVYRHLANLQAFGLWRKKEPLSHPTALELFTTTFATLTAGATSALPAFTPINSPLPQVSGPNGEKIDALAAPDAAMLDSPEAPQVTSSTLVVTESSEEPGSSEGSITIGIIHQQADSCGEKSITAAEPTGSGVFGGGKISILECSFPPKTPDPFHSPDAAGGQCEADSAEPHRVPIRPIRRGRPAVLDDLAKGKLLGLMSYGLSFRQAAAQLGIHHVTILNTMKRDEEFAQQVAEARLDAISQPLLTVIAASRKNWRAAAWLAKFLDGRRTSAYEATPEERELARK